MRVRGVSRVVQDTASILRRSETPAERALWQMLRARKLSGVKFRRQQPLGRFVLDFVSTSHRLIIELDGDIHDLQPEQDAARTAHLQTYGYRVIRFKNDEVLNNLD